MLKTVKKLAHGVGICTNIKVDKSVSVSYTHLDVYKRQALGKPGAKARPRGVVDAHTVEIP